MLLQAGCGDVLELRVVLVQAGGGALRGIELEEDLLEVLVGEIVEGLGGAVGADALGRCVGAECKEGCAGEGKKSSPHGMSLLQGTAAGDRAWRAGRASDGT